MARLNVEVVYAEQFRQEVVSLVVEDCANAISAVRASGLLRSSPSCNQDQITLGIFGRIVAPGTILHDGDRVEIYRPLNIDPKDERRIKAARTSRRKPNAAG